MLDDSRLILLAREGAEIVKISSPKRGIPASLRRWLERAYPTCGAGCGARERLQIDHIVPVEEHGPTCKENTWRICPHCHRLKTVYGWRVVTDEEGVRRLVPPDDPDPP